MDNSESKVRMLKHVGTALLSCAMRCRCIAAAALIVITVAVSPRLAAHPALEVQLQQLDGAIALAPENAELLLRRAELFRLHGQLNEALNDLDAVQRVGPGTANLAYHRARLFRDMKRYEDALRLIEYYDKEHPGSPEAHFLRAGIHRELEQRERSIEAFKKGLALVTRPTPDHYIELATMQRSNGDSNAALTTIDQGIGTLGPIISLELAAVNIALQDGLFDSALWRIDRLKAAGMQEESRLMWRARTLAKAGRGTEANATYVAARNAIVAQSVQRQAMPANQQILAEIESALLKDTGSNKHEKGQQ